MAIIAQQSLFSWKEMQNLGDLERLVLVLDNMPDEKLMIKLERSRGNGRNDYPVRAMWNTVLAGVVFQHESIEKLRRELSRNAQMRSLCGLESGVPSAAAYTRFMKALVKYEKEMEEMFDELVGQVSAHLPGFGTRLAVDSKAIDSFANNKSAKEKEDGRRDLDADYGRKEYRGVSKDGKPWEKIVKWFGYKLHLVVDADYELPVAFEVTKASSSDVVIGGELFDQMKERVPSILETAEVLSADKAYDSSDYMSKCWDEYGIKPVIDIRNMWKDKDASRLYGDYNNVAYNYKGTVTCYCPATGTEREMCNGGFEKDRSTLKKLCPAKVYGTECLGKNECPVAQGLRIPLSADRRIFTPIDRNSPKWKKEYNKRTSVERVNSRLDVSFGFELHTTRGMKKMKLRCGLALSIMLAMALGHIKQNELDRIRSLVA